MSRAAPSSNARTSLVSVGENLETEDNFSEQDRNFAFNSLRVESAGMGPSRTKSFSVVGMGQKNASSTTGSNFFSATSQPGSSTLSKLLRKEDIRQGDVNGSVKRRSQRSMSDYNF